MLKSDFEINLPSDLSLFQSVLCEMFHGQHPIFFICSFPMKYVILNSDKIPYVSLGKLIIYYLLGRATNNRTQFVSFLPHLYCHLRFKVMTLISEISYFLYSEVISMFFIDLKTVCFGLLTIDSWTKKIKSVENSCGHGKQNVSQAFLWELNQAFPVRSILFFCFILLIH
jgi:hypothetical protein